jgi:glyoxylase-like metal-dependent hydrolase (beta-lactamase superfamily II)
VPDRRKRTVKCPLCGWSKVTAADPARVLAGHGGECPNRTAPARRGREVKWRDWRTEDKPFIARSPAEMQELKRRQRGMPPAE